MASRGLAPELLEVFVDSILFQNFGQIPLLYPMVYNTKSTGRAFVDEFRVAGLGRFAVKPEGVPVSFSDPVQGDRRRTTVDTFALAFRVTKEMRDDEQHGIIARMAGDLGNAARDSQDRLAFAPINDGYAGSTYTGLPEGDGTRRALWNTGHVPLRNLAATQSNRLSPGVALSTSGLEAALSIADTMQSEEERYIRQEFINLLIHPDERFNAAQLLESEFEINTADNQINPVSRSQVGLSVVNNGRGAPYITDTDSWSLWASGADALRWHNREELRTAQTSDALTFDEIEIAFWRSAVEIGEWRDTVGSAP